jgi:hypothetical protein
MELFIYFYGCELMPAQELLCQIAGIDPYRLSKTENLLIEAELFIRLIEKLTDYFRERYMALFQSVKFDKNLEISMFENNFTRCIINDILSSDEYTMPGIAYYTHTPEEILIEIASGLNTSPSVELFRKIIELHRTVRSDLYKVMMEKILSQYSKNTISQ